MLTTVAKRIQTSLKRKGVVATSGDIKDYLKANAGNIENITKEEENNATKYFLSNATKLTVVSDDVTTEDLTEVEETFSSVGGELGNISTPAQMELETLTSEDVDTVNSVDNVINTASIQDIDSSDLYTNEAALTTATKSELVASTAGELGIVLNTGEIELIAQNVNYSSDDLQESLEEIKSAIIAFVRHKIALNSQKIGETLEEITQVATDGFNQNSQQLTDGLQNINKQLQQQRTDFKSKVKATLSVFQLPAAS
jgi:hypothetical protein